MAIPDDPTRASRGSTRPADRKRDRPGAGGDGAEEAAKARVARGAAPIENSIRPSVRRRQAPASRGSEGGQPPGPAMPEAARAGADSTGPREGPADKRSKRSDPSQSHVPPEIRERFVQVGKHYHFPDGTRAFTDRGRRLTTPSENTEVIRSLVSIAQARGWGQITVRGTERFRKEAWFAARTAGLEVRGYRPSEFEQAHLVRTLARGEDKISPDPATGQLGLGAQTSRQSREAAGATKPEHREAIDIRDRLLVGKLVDHGRAAYHHDPHEPMSYFVKIETSHGDRTIWGVDLERAFRQSLTRPQVGDDIGLRAVRQEAVKVRTHERDADGKVIGEKDLATHRNQWIVEKRAFFEARAEAARTLRDATVDSKQAVKRHPELVGTYLQVHAAELAARQFRDPQEQQRFVSQIRSALADSVARGEPLPPVRLREKASERRAGRSASPRDRESAPVRS